jgi:uncharacterized protein
VSKNTLLIFVRLPILGQVKTRLAKTLGDEEALRIYRFLLKKTRSVAAAISADRFLFYTEIPTTPDEWPSDLFDKKLQSTGDLGARMAHAFQTAFRDGAEKALIIGSDCPELRTEILQQAYEQLSDNDVVIGPVQDGGYYMLGMKKFYPELFEGIAWSTESVFQDTVAIVEKLGLDLYALPVLNDIDTEADWRAYLSRSGEDDF